MRRNTFLVTGTPRSGTTVVGDILGLAPSTVTLYEPMNGDSGDRSVDRYFEIPGAHGYSKKSFADLVSRVSRLDLKLRPGNFAHETGLRKLAKKIIGGRSRHSLRMAKLQPTAQNVIWKDPIAPFAARAFIECTGQPVVATFRPPHAVVASLKRLNWTYNIQEIDDGLKGKYLSRNPMRSPDDVVEGGAALWAMVYGELMELHEAYPDKVHFVSTEYLIDDALPVFERLFDDLSLEMTDKIREKIVARFTPKDAPETPNGHPHSRNRDIRPANESWRKILTENEIAVVNDRVGTIREFYDTRAFA